MTMQRAVKISLKFATQAKANRLAALLSEYQAAVNFYIRSLWRERGGFDAETMRRYAGGSLSYRYRTVALKQALQIVIATRKAAKATGCRASMPKFTGYGEFSSLVATVERGRGSFDYVLKISSLIPGKRIVIPFKSHKRLNYWLAKPMAQLCGTVMVREDTACLIVELPDSPEKTAGDVLAVDTGYNKLFVDSDGTRYGTDLKAHCQRVRSCKPGGKGKRRAIRARNDYINRTCKQLPWHRIRELKCEDLTGLKQRTQRKDKSSKKTRKQMAPWTYRLALRRIEYLAAENRVCLTAIDPRNTSRSCPRCGMVAKVNRKGEKFQCIACNLTGDADYIGALNILAKPAVNKAEPMVPLSAKVHNVKV
jgi:transposase